MFFFKKKVKQFAGPGKLVMAGSGCESTAHTIEMSKLMAGEGGADCVLVVTPSYFKVRKCSMRGGNLLLEKAL